MRVFIVGELSIQDQDLKHQDIKSRSNKRPGKCERSFEDRSDELVAREETLHETLQQSSTTIVEETRAAMDWTLPLPLPLPLPLS